MNTVAGRSDIESNVEFTFDLREALVTKDVGSNGVYVEESKCPQCTGLVGLSLFLTASQYDVYRVFLRSLGIPAAIEFIGRVDIVLRCCLFLFFISYAVAIYVHGSVDIELGGASMIYFASFTTSLAFYVGERLARQFDKYVTSRPWMYYVERFAMALYDRKNFAGPKSALLVSAVFVLSACGMSLVMLFALTILRYDNDAAALVLVCSCFAAEVVYTLARLGRFKALTEQGWQAAYIASFHTTFTTTLSFPITVVYVIMLLTRD